MATLAYMPFFVGDYLADTAHLSTVEHGAYLMLIMNYWQRGEPLPADDARLARIARLSLNEWCDVRSTLAEFFDEQGGKWTHSRIESELEIAREKSEKARCAGRLSASRRTKSKKISEGVANAEQTFNERSTDVQRTFNLTGTGTGYTSSLRSDVCAPALAKAKREKRGLCALPADWGPSDDLISGGRGLGLTDSQIRSEAQAMRDWSLSKGERRADWDATFRGWLKRTAERRSPTGPPRQQKPTFADLLRKEFEHERDCQLEPKAAPAFILDDPFARPADQRVGARFAGPVLDL